jgi:magnesium transporter
MSHFINYSPGSEVPSASSGLVAVECLQNSRQNTSLMPAHTGGRAVGRTIVSKPDHVYSTDDSAGDRGQMSKRSRRHKNRPGRSAGPFDIATASDEEHIPTSIKVTTYDASHFEERDVKQVDQLRDLISKGHTVWIRVLGLKDREKIEQLARILELHHLAIEDVFTTQQRAQLGIFDKTFFLLAHVVENHSAVAAKQLSLFFHGNYVVTFQSEPIQTVELVHTRIQNDREMIRLQSAAYLVYLILSSIVESYFPVLEDFGERLDDLEEAAIEDPSRRTMSAIHSLKRQLLSMRRAIWPLREAVNSLLRDAGPVLSDEARIHLRDCYDEIVRVIDFIETYRELGADLMDVYLSSVSNRLNEIMKILTIITVVFAPPTLIAAIYGMNFDNHISPLNMPEYNWYYGYPYALILMLCTSVLIYSFLKARGFLDLSSRTSDKQNEQP